MKVYEAISKVMAVMATSGISKNNRNQQQGYSFRGIDDIYNALSRALSDNLLCVLPRVLTRTCVERQTRNNSVLFYVTVEVEFDFVSSEDGSKHTVKTFGEAMDSADKATNKAMSAAYKYACMQAFCIPTEGDNDADATTHTVAPANETQVPIFASLTDISKIKSLLLLCGISEEKALKQWDINSFDEILQDWVIGLIADLEAFRSKQTKSTASGIGF